MCLTFSAPAVVLFNKYLAELAPTEVPPLPNSFRHSKPFLASSFAPFGIVKSKSS